MPPFKPQKDIVELSALEATDIPGCSSCGQAYGAVDFDCPVKSTLKWRIFKPKKRYDDLKCPVGKECYGCWYVRTGDEEFQEADDQADLIKSAKKILVLMVLLKFKEN